MSTFEATLFGLMFGLCTALGIIGCASKKVPWSTHVEQYYIDEAHKRQLEEWRRDGRLPAK